MTVSHTFNTLLPAIVKWRAERDHVLVWTQTESALRVSYDVFAEGHPDLPDAMRALTLQRSDTAVLLPSILRIQYRHLQQPCSLVDTLNRRVNVYQVHAIDVDHFTKTVQLQVESYSTFAGPRGLPIVHGIEEPSVSVPFRNMDRQYPDWLARLRAARALDLPPDEWAQHVLFGSVPNVKTACLPTNIALENQP